MFSSFVVFTDVESDELLNCIRETASEVMKEARVIRVKSFCLDGLTGLGVPSNEFLSHCHSKNRRPSLSSFECFITDKPATSADAIYALNILRIPVLSLSMETPKISNKHFLLEDLYSYQDLEGINITVVGIIQRFLSFPSQKGHLFVLEGGDGSGKHTQAELLVRKLENESFTVKTLEYPIDQALFGFLIRSILHDKEKIDLCDHIFFSTLYSVNRFDTLPFLVYWLQRGYVILLDRYFTANFGHQVAKEVNKEHSDVIRQLYNFEVEWLGLPPPDHVFYLDIPPELALQSMKKDINREELDLQETADMQYKNTVRSIFLTCCDNNPAVWHCISSINIKTGNRYTIEEIHSNLYSQIKSLL